MFILKFALVFVNKISTQKKLVKIKHELIFNNYYYIIKFPY